MTQRHAEFDLKRSINYHRKTSRKHQQLFSARKCFYEHFPADLSEVINNVARIRLNIYTSEKMIDRQTDGRANGHIDRINNRLPC